ncbi:hypothetical protein U8527_11425 [Kordia algicida OT-1]|uniref:Uncharacterized protein n=1 Tax=Kordia algicida OT-1 TaxID=391587 RepID=A9DZB0_9FLAO|nr:hypothetical protein [Kordia algicida]EDP95719.1 hypothetical protein KAOT1_04927 [Kordia algicida OT-1]
MKKSNVSVKLTLQKKIIASLDTIRLKGGIKHSDDPTVDNSLGKQSTCPIETCTCEPVRV